MYELFETYLIFLKIGGLCFGGGYAMLPFIEQEIIKNHSFLNYKEFFDILSISQITPGPIAINVATFIGLRYLGIVGAFFSTIGVITMPFVFMSIVNIFINKYKNSNMLNNIFLYIRPITLSLIFLSFISAFQKTILDVKYFIIFTISFLILINKKLHPILVIFLFGIFNLIYYMIFKK